MNKKMSVSRALSGKRYENVRTNLDTFDTVKTSVEDVVVRTPGPLFRYTTTTQKMFANTTSSAAAAVQRVVDHGRCVSFWWCRGLLFFLSRVSNLNPALCFSLDYCGTDFDRKKKRNTHTRTTTLSPSRKKGPADRIDDVNDDFCVLRSFSFVLRSFSTRL